MYKNALLLCCIFLLSQTAHNAFAAGQQEIYFSEPTIREITGRSSKRDGFWSSYIPERNYVTGSLSSAGEKGSLLFIVSNSQENNCDYLAIELYTCTKNKLMDLTDKHGTINIDNGKRIYAFQYMSENYRRDHRERPFCSDISFMYLYEKTDHMIEAMRKGNVMHIDLPDQKIRGAFSLQGFAASLNRAGQLCRSGAR